MRRSLLVFALAGILALFVTAAFAQNPDHHPLFDKMDTNKDGFLTKEEIQKRFPKFTDEMMKQADTNGDGKLTVAEWRTFAKAKRAEHRGGANMM
ncbi:MAG: EF-hand domain-containing protein [Desulfovibrio sp.]|nr:EF-hand domain-containing protein [Desulfovibrio sp.]MBI4961108.1 EF-hand domain-containing protein [Desulfovibrio sp.]